MRASPQIQQHRPDARPPVKAFEGVPRCSWELLRRSELGWRGDPTEATIASRPELQDERGSGYDVVTQIVRRRPELRALMRAPKRRASVRAVGTITCPECDTEKEPDAKYFQHCGNALVPIAPWQGKQDGDTVCAYCAEESRNALYRDQCGGAMR